MKKLILASMILSNFSFAEMGNEVQIADLKEAVYKLIKNQRRLSRHRTQIVYKMIPREKSYLDGYIKNFVKRNKHLLPLSGSGNIK